jgi:homoserine kinase
MRTCVTVNAPASTANLGPGFDCLALALDLWNQATFTLEGQGIRVRTRGEGTGLLPQDERNLVARAALRLYQSVGAPVPLGLQIQCDNHIPLSSGLGSSAAAIATGLLGANALLGDPAGPEEILRLATALEGHPDNVAAALLGGLTLAISSGEGVLARCLPVAPFQVILGVPAMHLPTQVARAALPREVPLSDAVYNIGRTAYLIEALRSGDLALLGKVMDDRLHQPYRLKLIPGGAEAFQAARKAGAQAVALSGAGPSIVAIAPVEDETNPDQGDPTANASAKAPAIATAIATAIAAAIVTAFEQQGMPARSLILSVSDRGAYCCACGGI